jgi:NADPH2 dehydrogenase
MAPLTRYRADDKHVHGELGLKYYEQRASVPGTLLITEATFIAERAGGDDNVPGIWSDEQVEGWKKIVTAVHAKGSFIYLQLWALGRTAIRDMLPKQYDIVSSGNLPAPPSSLTGSKDAYSHTDGTTPRPLTVAEIDEYVETYVQAARNAIRAGFDGVEVHSANGYLPDQFLQLAANNRTDSYGGSAQNRIRFTTRIVQSIASEIGADRVAVRLSPYERFNGMYTGPRDALETFSLLIRTLAPLGLAYLHLTEPRVSGLLQACVDGGYGLKESIEWAAGLWFGRDGAEEDVREALGVEKLPEVEGTPASTNALVVAGGYTPETAAARAEEAEKKGERVVIAFGRYFISNPDLPARIINGLPLAKYDRPSFYNRKSPEGYIDYPFAAEHNATE